VAKIALERCGYQVIAAADGQKGVDAFERDPDAIALILLDMAMPGLSGEETLKRLRAIRSDTPVVVSSGFSEMDARAKFGDAISAFLQKPYTAKQLSAEIGAILRGRAASGC
jgi:DNA-binding response OmpR family regulator